MLRPCIVLALASAFFTHPALASSDDLFLTTKPEVAPYGRLPLLFEPNGGQADPAVKFLARGSNYTVGLTPTGAIFATTVKAAVGARSAMPSTLLRLKLAGGNPHPVVEGLERQSGRVNYYLGSSEGSWRTDIPVFAKVRYRSVYPGIDLVHYGNGGRWEYDFLVHPRANPKSIRLEISGATAVSITSGGALRIRAAAGDLEFEPPVAYQEINGARRNIVVNYVLTGSAVTFRLGPFNRDKPLIIDPVLAFSTYLTGNNTTEPRGIAVDDSGSVYVVGETFALNFPLLNPFQSTNHGSTDVFLTKLNAGGTAIVYSTYFGGLSFDSAGGIAVDSAGSAYITGNTDSTDFPTSADAFQRTCSGTICHAAFAAKFQPDGTLAYSTLNGASMALGRAIAVDDMGHAHITGGVSSHDLPIVNAYQTTLQGAGNAFVQKLNPAGTGFVYSTYFGIGGSSASTMGRGIALDSSGSAHIVGTSSGAALPLKQPIQSGPTTGFLAKFTPDGGELAYSTYIGGTGNNGAIGVAVNSAGSAIVAGTTDSCDFPLSTTAFSITCGGNRAFLVKVNSSGSGYDWATLVGGGFAAGLDLDSDDNIYVGGTTAASDFPVLSAIQTTLQQGPPFNSDGFVTKFGSSGQLVFSTFIGGAGTTDELGGLAAGPAGEVYVTGNVAGTHSLPMDFPLLNPIQPSAGCCGLRAGIVSKIRPPAQPVISLSPLTSPLITLRNMGNADLQINTIVTSANFTKGGSCGSVVAAGDNCWLFLQGASDMSVSGTVTISSNAPGSPHTFTIAKSPFGDASNPVLRFSASRLQFPTQQVGTTSDGQLIRLTNPSLLAVSIGNILVNPPFFQTNNCGSSLAPSSSCTISVVFTPTAAGPTVSGLTISHSLNSNEHMFVSGVGSSGPLAASPSNISFGEQFVDETPLTRIVEVTNVGLAPISLEFPVVTGLFSANSLCDTLAPRQSCRVPVTFKPNGNRFETGTLTLIGGSAQVVTLQGSGRIRSDLTVSPPNLDFFNVNPGQSTSQTVTVTNGSNASVSVTAVNIIGDYSRVNNCSAPLAPNASCTVTVTFAPTAVGPRDGALTIHHSGGGAPQIVFLAGTGRRPLTLNPAELAFDPQQLGTESPRRFLSVGNGTGFSSSITLGPFAISGDFRIDENPCPTVLPRFMGCALQIVFEPTGLGLRSGTLSITASDSPTPHLVPLRGMGTGTGLSSASIGLNSSPDRAMFGQPVTFTATILNTGTGTPPAGGVAFNDGTSFLSSVSLTGGAATFTTTNLSVGRHLVNAFYSGDGTFMPATSPLAAVTIDKASTAAGLSSSPNPSISGQPVSLTASVSPAAVRASGTVTFYDGTSAIGMAPLNSSGIATLTKSNLSTGVHSLSAVFHGDGNYFSSSSSSVVHVVGASGTATTVSLTLTGDSKVLFRGSTQFSVTVTSGAGTPAGTVLLLDGGRSLSTAQLNGSGQAIFSTNQLSIGVRQIRAVYLGNGTFAGATSAPVLINRSPRPR